MRYQTMMNTDMKLSCVCLGGAGFGNTLDEETSFAVLDAFAEDGGNFIDTANVYCRWVPGLENCSEKLLGRWLKSRNAYNDVVIATKGAHYRIDDPLRTPRLSENDIRTDIEDSLKALGIETIDFYWLHRDDPNKPIEEIVDILEDLRKEGKLRYYGFSNFKTERAEKARIYLEQKGRHGPYAISNQWSTASINKNSNLNPDPTLVVFDDEEYRWHEKTGIPAIPYSASALGFFDKLHRLGENIPPHLRAAYWNEENLNKYKMLVRISEETGHSIHALSIAWLISGPHAKSFRVFPVCGVSSMSQLKDIIDAGNISSDVFSGYRL